MSIQLEQSLARQAVSHAQTDRSPRLVTEPAQDLEVDLYCFFDRIEIMVIGHAINGDIEIHPVIPRKPG